MFTTYKLEGAQKYLALNSIILLLMPPVSQHIYFSIYLLSAGHYYTEWSCVQSFMLIHLFPGCHSGRVLPSAWKLSSSVPFLLLLACAVPVLGEFHLQTYLFSLVPRSETHFVNFPFLYSLCLVWETWNHNCGSKSVLSCSLYHITMSLRMNGIPQVAWSTDLVF